MSGTDKDQTESQASAEEAKEQADKVSDKGTHGGQGNAFQINDEADRPGEDAKDGPQN